MNEAPVISNVVLRKDAENAARVAYATGRRDAMLALASELQPLQGQFLSVVDVVEAITKAASEFNESIVELEALYDAESAKSRSRIIVPS